MNDTTEHPAVQRGGGNAAEPLSAILAEMRADKCIPHHIDWADRIEAAVKREREAAQSSRDARDAMDYAATAARPAFVGVDLAKDKPTFVCATIAPGNAAAMRAALMELLNEAEHGYDIRDAPVAGAPGERQAYHVVDAEYIINTCRSALAAPARNCDRFQTAEEAQKAWAEYNHNYGPFEHWAMAAIDWLFAPAEGGAE